MGADSLRFRPPTLVAALLDHVYEAHRPVPWLELIDLHSDDDHPWRTVENVVYDLIAYGALHRIGHPGTRRRPDTRALVPTPLGAAWLAQDPPPPLPGASP